MTRPTLFIASPIWRNLEAELTRRYELVHPGGSSLLTGVEALSPTDKARIGAIIALGVEPIDARLLEHLPAVKLICCLGSGYDGIDRAAAAARGITVTHSRGGNASSVADVAIGLVIECVRDMPRLRGHLVAGAWNGLGATRPEGRPGLTGRNLGVYGLGEIGRKIATRAEALEMHVGYNGRHRQDDAGYPFFDSLQALAEWSDVLVLAARADAANRNIVSGDVLRALGPMGYLVNIARGSLVDETALIAALRDGSIAGAGLDVFVTEPNPPLELVTLPNVAATPHIGGVTVESRSNMIAMTLANVEAHFAGRAPPYAVR